MLCYSDTSCDAAMVASQEVFASKRASPGRCQENYQPVLGLDRVLTAIGYLAISDQDCGPIPQTSINTHDGSTAPDRPFVRYALVSLDEWA